MQPHALGLLLLIFPEDTNILCSFGKGEPHLMSVCCFCLPLHPMIPCSWCEGKGKSGSEHVVRNALAQLCVSFFLTFFVHLKVIGLLLSANCIFPSPSRAQPSPAAVIKAPRLLLQWPNASKCWFPSHTQPCCPVRS